MYPGVWICLFVLVSWIHTMSGECSVRKWCNSSTCRARLRTFIVQIVSEVLVRSQIDIFNVFLSGLVSTGGCSVASGFRIFG